MTLRIDVQVNFLSLSKVLMILSTALMMNNLESVFSCQLPKIEKKEKTNKTSHLELYQVHSYSMFFKILPGEE